MHTETKTIRDTIGRVEDERSLRLTEQCRFRTFRTAISRATVDGTDRSSETVENLLETYRETVMDIPNFETAYDESSEESLK